jgi:hypothetical protein
MRARSPTQERGRDQGKRERDEKRGEEGRKQGEQEVERGGERELGREDEGVRERGREDERERRRVGGRRATGTSAVIGSGLRHTRVDLEKG